MFYWKNIKIQHEERKKAFLYDFLRSLAKLIPLLVIAVLVIYLLPAFTMNNMPTPSFPVSENTAKKKMKSVENPASFVQMDELNGYAFGMKFIDEQSKQEYVCLVDVNVMYGALEFYTKATNAGLKPVIGLSAYADNKEYVLLARDYAGYIILCNLSSAINHNKNWKIEDYASDHVTLISQNKAPGFKSWFSCEDLAIHESLFVSKSDFSKYKALLAINKGCLYSDIEDDKDIASKYLLNDKQAHEIFSDAQITRTNKLLNEINLNIPLNKDNFFVKFDPKKNSAMPDKPRLPITIRLAFSFLANAKILSEG